MTRPRTAPEPENKTELQTLVEDLRGALHKTIDADLDALEATLQQRIAQRLSGADTLIARLRDENAALATENERVTRTLTRLRELANAS